MDDASQGTRFGMAAWFDAARRGASRAAGSGRLAPAARVASMLLAVAAPLAAQDAVAAAVPPQSPSALVAPAWEAAFGAEPGVGKELFPGASVRALAVWDDGLGDGPVLFVGGDFETAGGLPASRLARWDGSAWTPVGVGVSGTVNALAVHDDGSGAKLYVGGSFSGAGGVPGTAFLARWDGAAFSAVGAGVNGAVQVLHHVVDGLATYLVLGGDFTTAGGAPANRAALLLGGLLVPFGAGFNASVRAFALHDGEIYAGGFFTTSGATPVARLARWTGSAWTAVDGGANGPVLCLRSWGLGSLDGLYVGGQFTSVGTGAGVPASGIARWDAGAWSGVAGGVSGKVSALAAFDDGSGEDLYLTGVITTAGGAPLANPHVLRFDGSAFNTLGAGLSAEGRALVVHDDGSGPSLWAAGDFLLAGGIGANGVARWDGSAWHATGSGLNDDVYALHASSAFPGGPRLFASGEFHVPGAAGERGIGSWQDGTWFSLGEVEHVSSPPLVIALAEFNDGSGNALYAGGQFTSIGGVPATHIARWTVDGWSDVGGGLGGSSGSYCTALAVHDDGGGPALYASGNFVTAGGTLALGIARWDGSAWSALGAGFAGEAHALKSFDDGSGPALYATGSISAAGGVTASGIARWKDGAWEALGAGLTCCGVSLGGVGFALEVFDDGTGPSLYVGGQFETADLVPNTQGVARWDAGGWSGLAGALGDVRELAVFDDGSGKSLFAGGAFTTIGGAPFARLARWDGSAWQAVGTGPGNNTVHALAVFDDGSGVGPRLAVGGSFTTLPDVAPQAASRLAFWNGGWEGVDNWTDLGFALAGVAGDPHLFAGGPLTCGSLNLLSLSNAAPLATAGLFLAFSSTPTPFAGGTLVPFPFIGPFLFVTGPTGEIPISFVLPPGLPPGTEMYLQWGIDDAAAVSGIALSNAVRGDVP